MKGGLLPGEGDDLFGEVEVVGKEFLSLVVDEVVVVLPAEDEFDVASIFKGSHDLAEVDVGDVGSLVCLGGEILVEDDHSFLQDVSVDYFFLGL